MFSFVDEVGLAEGVGDSEDFAVGEWVGVAVALSTGDADGVALGVALVSAAGSAIVRGHRSIPIRNTFSATRSASTAYCRTLLRWRTRKSIARALRAELPLSAVGIGHGEPNATADLWL